jgi:hypothetical protein
MEVETRKAGGEREEEEVEEMVFESSTPLASHVLTVNRHSGEKAKREVGGSSLALFPVHRPSAIAPHLQPAIRAGPGHGTFSPNIPSQQPQQQAVLPHPSQPFGAAHVQLQNQREQQERTAREQSAEREEQLNDLRALKDAQQSLIRERQRNAQVDKQMLDDHSHTKQLERYEKEQREAQARLQREKEKEMQKENEKETQEKEKEREREHREKLLKENRERKEGEEREREQRQRELLAREGRLKERQVEAVDDYLFFCCSCCS